MGELIQEMAAYGQDIIQFSWFPLLIWTVLSGILLLSLRLVRGTHPQYQYHCRLALLFSLPAGFIALGVLQYVGTFLSTPSESLAIISVTAPFEISVSSNAAASNSISTTSFLYSVIFLLLSGGLIVFAIRNLLQWFHLIRLKDTCDFQPIENQAKLDYNNRLLITETEKKIQITFRDEDIIPVTFGIKYPVIILPKSLKTDDEKLNLVLRHELTHIVQNDFLSNVMISLTQILFWFHPVVHFLKRELIDYREIRCDSLVLSNNSVSRKKYASLLLELLPMPNINKELSVNMAQESSNLKKRIQMITQQKPNRPTPKWSSLAIFAFIILSTTIAMSCTDMQTQGDETSDAVLQAESGEEGYFEVVEQMPELIGGLESISNKITYPEEARQNGVEGRVFVKFIVNKDGNVENAEVMRGIGSGADEEALRVVREAKFKPGFQDGEPVRVQYALPITFRLGSTTSDVNSDQVFKIVDEMPELIGGFEELRENIRYPEEAKQAGIEGRVYMTFVVNKQGDVENAKVVRGLGAGADEEALRVIRQAKFEPGYQNGEPVRVQYSIAIAFVLPREENQQ